MQYVIESEDELLGSLQIEVELAVTNNTPETLLTRTKQNEVVHKSINKSLHKIADYHEPLLQNNAKILLSNIRRKILAKNIWRLRNKNKGAFIKEFHKKQEARNIYLKVISAE